MPAPSVQPPQFPDRFAIEWGRDEYGLFQSFAVGDVVQRMRWIPPGTFWMGSPEDEVGRFDREIQHRVELARGYWLADTPVTQALWDAVMGTNPSQFKGPSHPVELVNWDDCQEFIARLNARIKGIEARLPTEAEWEYACRAGTTTATWAGDLLPGQESEPPQLDRIAWYSGNANDGTHPVAQKPANPWGLYDMLGNVWEWCPYGVSLHEAYTIRDITERSIGGYCVVRGGSWIDRERLLRSACRSAIPPSDRYAYVGFRLARSVSP